MTALHLPLQTAVMTRSFRNVRGDQKITSIRNAILEYKFLPYIGYPHQNKNLTVMFFLQTYLSIIISSCIYNAFFYCTRSECNAVVQFNQLLTFLLKMPVNLSIVNGYLLIKYQTKYIIFFHISLRVQENY